MKKLILLAVGLAAIFNARAEMKNAAVHHGGQRAEFCSRALDAWAYQRGVKLDFIRPGKPVDEWMH